MILFGDRVQLIVYVMSEVYEVLWLWACGLWKVSLLFILGLGPHAYGLERTGESANRASQSWHQRYNGHYVPFYDNDSRPYR